MKTSDIRATTRWALPMWRLALLLTTVGASACAVDPAPCTCPPSAPAAAATPAAAAPPTSAPATATAPAADLWSAVRPLAAGSASATLALDTAQDLFAGRFEPIRRLLIPDLAIELPPEKLAAIVDGLIKAHGPPVQVMDAWASEVREKEVLSPAAEVMLRMQNGKRIGLILVFDPQGAVKGLWLRPI